MAKFSERFRYAVARSGKTITDIARAAGVTPESIYMGLKRDNWRPRPASLSLFARAMGTTTEYLLTGIEPPIGNDEVSMPVPLDGRFHRAPVYRLSQVSAGNGTPSFVDEPQGYQEVSPRIAEIARGALAFVKVAGDSMSPTILNGDFIIAEMMFDMVPDAEIYIVRVAGDVLVKRLSRIGNQLSIKSDNPEYPTRIIGPDDEIEVQIIAAARGLHRDEL